MAVFDELKELEQLASEEVKLSKKALPIPFDLRETGIAGELIVDTHPDQHKAYHTHVILPENDHRQLLKQKYFSIADDSQTSVGGDHKNAQKYFPRVFDVNTLFSMKLSRPRRQLQIRKTMFATNGEVEEEIRETIIPKWRDSSTNSLSMLRRPGAAKDFVRGNSMNFPFQPGGIDKDELQRQQLSVLDKPGLRSGDEEVQVIDSMLDSSATLAKGQLLTVPPGFAFGIGTSEHETIEKEAQPSQEQVEHEDALEEPNPSQLAPVVIGSNPSGLIKETDKTIEDFETEEYYEKIDEKREKTEERKKKRKLRLTQMFSTGEDPFGLKEYGISLQGDQQQPNTEDSSGLESKVPFEKQDAKGAVEKLLDSFSNPEDKRADIDKLLDFEEEYSLADVFQKAQAQNQKTMWAVEKRITNIESKFDELVPEMAIEYPFDLDTFQKEAIYHLENNESVFVSAHTSAGKTVVAEYAIALAQKHLTRAIYTSPIKTLSNQKFREFKQTFDDVGILTGDVQINPAATCLIMTTEILRSMLYKGADLIRDIEWVIFDEVHYINDLERGVVWEEVIIMLPAHVNIILLSATVPNNVEFANWIGRTKKKNIYVISTEKRPVPLAHHLYFGSKLFKIVDHGSFLNGNYRQALELQRKKEGKLKRYSAQNNRHEWQKLITKLEHDKLLPVVIFAFSRKKCEEVAYGLQNLDLTNSKEKSDIHRFIDASISRLKEEDRKLPQVIKIKELLKRGIGVHHSGLLPIVKEVVEMLFQRGLVKVLFATETFAMGVNMPARTVVFESLRKHDGRSFRNLLSGEYIQISGRAGRRGLDTVGVVIIMCWKEIPEEVLIMDLILGKASTLESRFRLTYNMMLNLLRIEDFRVEDMMKRSFSEFFSQSQLPQNTTSIIHAAEKRLKELQVSECLYGEPDIEPYYETMKQLELVTADIAKEFFRHSKGSFLSRGRLIVIRTPEHGITLGAFDQRNKIRENFSAVVLKTDHRMKDYFAPTWSGLPQFSPSLFPNNGDAVAELVVDLPQDALIAVCKSTINYKGADQAYNARQLMDAWQKGEGHRVYLPNELKIHTIDIDNLRSTKDRLMAELKGSKCNACPKFEEQFLQAGRRFRLREQIDALKYASSDEHLDLMPEFWGRLRVLQRLKYIDSQNTVQIKGRVACEINSCDALIVTELIFENVFTRLSPEESVSLLSTLVCQDKNADEPKLTETLKQARDYISKLAISLGELQNDLGLDITPSEYASQLRFGLMEVAYEWARGMPFSEICKLTNILEGNIVRNIAQLDQACREVRDAARVIGDGELYRKMELASELVKRDIVFAASLYVT